MAVSEPTNLLLLAWAVKALAALFVGMTFGLLTFAQTKGSWPAALLAAMSASGAALVGLHALLD